MYWDNITKTEKNLEAEVVVVVFFSNYYLWEKLTILMIRKRLDEKLGLPNFQYFIGPLSNLILTTYNHVLWSKQIQHLVSISSTLNILFSISGLSRLQLTKIVATHQVLLSNLPGQSGTAHDHFLNKTYQQL